MRDSVERQAETEIIRFLASQPSPEQIIAFHPSSEVSEQLYDLIGNRIEPLTASGRATARLCRFNDEHHIEQRSILIDAGRFPRD